MLAASWIAYVWIDAGSHHFSPSYRLFALAWTGLWVTGLLVLALRLRIGFRRELPDRSAELENDRDEYLEAHERRPLGRLGRRRRGDRRTGDRNQDRGADPPLNLKPNDDTAFER